MRLGHDFPLLVVRRRQATCVLADVLIVELDLAN